LHSFRDIDYHRDDYDLLVLDIDHDPYTNKTHFHNQKTEPTNPAYPSIQLEHSVSTNSTIMASSTPQINTPTDSEASRARSRSPAVIKRLTHTYPFINQAIQSEESCRAIWASHQPQFIYEIKALSEALIDSETTNEELKRSLSTLSQQANESEARHGELLSQNYDLTETHARVVREKDATINALSLRAPTEKIQPLRTPFHPDPLEFSGNDPKELPAFLLKLQLKLRMNHDWWTSEQERMGYVVSLLTSKAYAQIAHGINEDGSISHPNVQAIASILTTAFGDLNAKANAAKRMMTLKQGHSPMATFLPDWHATAKATKWDDNALIDHLRNAIHTDVLNRISYLRDNDIPHDLLRYIEVVRRCDYEVRQADPDYFKGKKPASHVPHPPIPTVQPLTTSNGGDAMDLNATLPATWGKKDVEGGRRPKTDAEREARRTYCTEHKLCHWCTSSKHSSPNCTTAPWATGKA